MKNHSAKKRKSPRATSEAQVRRGQREKEEDPVVRHELSPPTSILEIRFVREADASGAQSEGIRGEERS